MSKKASAAQLEQVRLALADELVGVAEVAAMAGVKANTVAVWVGRGKLPKPIAVLQAGRIWFKRDIQRWLEAQS